MSILTNLKKFERTKFLFDLIKINGYEIINNNYVYNKLNEKITLRHVQCAHKFEISVEKFWHRNQRCPKCKIQRTKETNIKKYGSNSPMSDIFIKEKMKLSLSKLAPILCLNCKKLYIRKSGRSIFCTKSCRRHFEYIKNNPYVDKSCIYCNKNFQTRKQQTVCCSKKCSNFKFRSFHTDATKQKLSIIMINNFLSKKRNICKYGRSGYCFSNKLNKQLFYRSRLEKKYFEILDNDCNVFKFEYEPFYIEYFYVQKRRYIPDLLITYTDGAQKLVEIKPKFQLKAEKNICKFKAAEQYCQEKGLIFEVWTEDEINKLNV